ncbi:unnamed protein product [Amoebophrya sp. A25]|nr:unnamed protein product [Amoebophrya sp. A25]|eukprot:GSA25T00002495001.1
MFATSEIWALWGRLLDFDMCTPFVIPIAELNYILNFRGFYSTTPVFNVDEQGVLEGPLPASGLHPQDENDVVAGHQALPESVSKMEDLAKELVVTHKGILLRRTCYVARPDDLL